MTNILKKNDFLSPTPRLFTRHEGDPYDQIAFQSSDSFGDESAPVLASPLSWSRESVEIIADAACKKLPKVLQAIEENTVPSWLWRHQSRPSSKNIFAQENDLRDIFNRAVGSAVAKAWKLNLFSNEKQARSFYDETSFALMQRYIAISPDVLASWGLSWAYGLDEKQHVRVPVEQNDDASVKLSNDSIDALVSKAKEPLSFPLWKKLFTLPPHTSSTVTLRLSDTTEDWHSSHSKPAQAAIDVMALRHNDGSIHIDGIKHAGRLLTVLLDLQERQDVTISFINLSPLLMALGLAYDSDAGRAFAASLAALLTAECTRASAEMAALRGASEAFLSNRDAVMRSLRNHRRAVYGDGNDYEKLSILPAALPLKNCPDLALASEAQHSWDVALNHARAFDLRATEATDLTPSPVLAILMESTTQGLDPMSSLTKLQHNEDTYKTILQPAVGEVLIRLNFSRTAANATVHHIMGSRSLHGAPYLNHKTLRARGFTDVELDKVESYLANVDSIRLALTPWVIGIDFCLAQLKISPQKLNAPRFDLLHHLGFSDADIKAANLYCYGHGSVRNSKSVHLRYRTLFARHTEVSTEARIRMASAVQSFISCDAGITAYLSPQKSVVQGGEVALMAWRQGMKSLTIVFDPSIVPPLESGSATTARRIKASSQPHAKPFASLARRAKHSKSAASFVTKKQSGNRRSTHKS